MWICRRCCYRTYIISHRETPCLCSLNQYSCLHLQRTSQKLPLLLAKVQILKILKIAFLFLSSVAILSVKLQLQIRQGSNKVNEFAFTITALIVPRAGMMEKMIVDATFILPHV